MSDVTDEDNVFSWTSDPSLVGYCLTLVRGLTSDQVFERWDIEPVPGVDLTRAQATDEARRRGVRGIRVASAGEWALVIEFDSSLGANEKWLSALSWKTEAVNLFQSATGMDPFLLFSRRSSGDSVRARHPNNALRH